MPYDAMETPLITNFKMLTCEFQHMQGLHVKTYEEPYNTCRVRKAKLMVLLGAMSNSPRFRELSHDRQTDLAIRIERSCFSNTIDKANEKGIPCTLVQPVDKTKDSLPSCRNTRFHEMYSHRILETGFELDHNHNTWLINEIIDAKITCRVLGLTSVHDMNPGANQQIIENIELRKQQEVKLKTSAMYECENCGKRESTIRAVQARSADEAKDLIVTCCFCGRVAIMRN